MRLLLNKIKLDNFYSLFSKELNQDRIFGLDLLRFFAVTTVIIGHGAYLLPKKIAELHKYITFDGVNIFFALSGFLIGGILIKQLENNKASFSLLLDFWIRRWFRTLPTYFLILIILTFCYSITDPSFTFAQIKKFYIFCQNLYYPPPTYYFRESWSLSVEEWFYFTIPLFIFILINFLKFNPKTSILSTSVFVILVIGFLKYRIYLDPVKASAFSLYHNQVVIRLDSIMFGVIAAYINYYYSKIWNSIPLQLLITGICIFLIQKYIYIFGGLPTNWIPFYYIVLDYNLTSVATVLLLPYLSNFRKTKYKIGNLITIISLISYSMYLTHMSLIKNTILKGIPWTNFTTNYNIILPVVYCLYWILTIAFSIFLYKFYEIPTTRLREKFVLKRHKNTLIE